MISFQADEGHLLGGRMVDDGPVFELASDTNGAKDEDDGERRSGHA
jgi:hypothetical protein